MENSQDENLQENVNNTITIVSEETNNSGNTFINNKRKRGRPEKGIKEKKIIENEYNKFFDLEERKTKKDENIGLEKIKEYFKNFFLEFKKKPLVEFEELKNIKDIKDIDNYSFYILFVENWEKKNDKLFPIKERFCYTFKIHDKHEGKYNLDQLFFLYLKKFSKKANESYFHLMLIFIIILREYINFNRKKFIGKEIKSENRKLYSQIYNAEIIPDISNDFFLIFMRKFDIEDYFLFDKKDDKKDEKNDVKTELKNLYQHLCFWLYEENHIVSMLYLIPKKDEKEKK